MKLKTFAYGVVASCLVAGVVQYHFGQEAADFVGWSAIVTIFCVWCATNRRTA